MFISSSFYIQPRGKLFSFPPGCKTAAVALAGLILYLFMRVLQQYERGETAPVFS
jgi:hypothetical protein